MDEIELLRALNTKVAALEIVAIAVMRDRREDPKFWENLEKVTALTLADLESYGDPGLVLKADDLHHWIHLWRQVAGPDGRSPAQP